MGHMNVRFYVAKAMEGAFGFFAATGLPDVARPGAPATVRVLSHHIRFHREARPGEPLAMTAHVAQLSGTGLTLCQTLTHPDGRVCATFLAELAHVATETGKPFPWTSRVAQRLPDLVREVPEAARPRSLTTSHGPTAPSLGAADALGLTITGRGLVAPADVDCHGLMRTELVIGRISDSVPNLMFGWRERLTAQAAETTGRPVRSGAAVLEFRLDYRAWPAVGDRIELRSAVSDVGDKTQTLTHWLLDPLSGAAWATAKAVAVSFDLDTRKTLPIPPAERSALLALRVEGV
jgi:acyl-CoA thioester hydrolase